jgi:1,4-alpha-glucan branching enzyme
MVEVRVLEKRSRAPLKRVSLVAQAPDAKKVIVTGDFTGWSEEGIPLKKGSNGDWQTFLQLAPGEYQYRLRVDGQWQDHVQARKRVPNPFGSENCVLSVEG